MIDELHKTTFSEQYDIESKFRQAVIEINRAPVDSTATAKRLLPLARKLLGNGAMIEKSLWPEIWRLLPPHLAACITFDEIARNVILEFERFDC